MKKFENTSLKRDDWRSTNIIWRGKLSRNIWRKRGINSRFLFSFIPKLAHFLKNLFSIWHFFKHYLFSFFSLFFWNPVLSKLVRWTTFFAFSNLSSFKSLFNSLLPLSHLHSERNTFFLTFSFSLLFTISLEN